MSSPCRLRESSTPPGAEAPGPAHHRPSSIPGERRRRGGSAPFGGCLDEMDVRRAVAAAVEKPKPLRRSLRRGFLPDDQRRGCEPAARPGGRKRALSEALAVGRVEKDEACGRVRRSEAGGVAVENEGLVLDAGFRDVGAQEGLRPCAVVDEGRPGRAAGKGFEAERAGAREEVEHCRAFGEPWLARMLKRLSRTRSAVGLRCAAASPLPRPASCRPFRRPPTTLTPSEVA